MNHNSIAGVAEEEGGQPALPFRLTGSQAKTAYALEKNVDRMISEAGLSHCGFLTLTVGDTVEGRPFSQIWDAAEASRRINSLMSNFLRALFPRAVVVTERHRSGAIHFHLIVECRADIRSGFDFAAFLRHRDARKRGDVDADAERAYEASATPALRGLWELLRERLPAFGFGRAEMTPIYKTGEAVARYVSTYVEKNLFNRCDEDRRKKLVRYMGWQGSQMKPNAFSWANERAAAWRSKARTLAGLVGVETRADVSSAFGPRWAYKLTRVMHAVDDRPVLAFEWQHPEREAARTLVAREARCRWMDERERRNGPRPVEWQPVKRPQMPDYFPNMETTRAA